MRKAKGAPRAKSKALRRNTGQGGPRQGAGSAAVICPVQRIAAEQAALIAACKIEDAADEKTMRDGWHLTEMIEDWKDVNEALASVLRARSFEGALFQLALVKEAIDDLVDCLRPADEEWRANRAQRRAYQLLYSIKGVLQLAAVGVLDDDIIADHYMSMKFDPHTQLAEIKALVVAGDRGAS